MKNPFFNAVLAALYIVAVASTMYFGSGLFPHEDTVLVPIAMLSLFVLSAAVMGYLFLLGPVQLYLEDNIGGAVRLLVNTILVFACFTVLFFAGAITWATFYPSPQAPAQPMG